GSADRHAGRRSSRSGCEGPGRRRRARGRGGRPWGRPPARHVLNVAHPFLLDAMRRQAAFQRLAATLPEPGQAVSLSGLPGSAAALLVAALAEHAPNRLWVVAAPSPP